MLKRLGIFALLASTAITTPLVGSASAKDDKAKGNPIFSGASVKVMSRDENAKVTGKSYYANYYGYYGYYYSYYSYIYANYARFYAPANSSSEYTSYYYAYYLGTIAASYNLAAYRASVGNY